MSHLNDELAAAGFRPRPLEIPGVVAWTGWLPPTEVVYERYYEHLRAAMIAQVDRGDDRCCGHIHSSIVAGVPRKRTEWYVRNMRRERITVVSAWRAASQVAPL